MMANEIGAWLWIFADVILLAILTMAMLGWFVLPSVRGLGLRARVRRLMPAMRSYVYGKLHLPQKTA